MDGSMLSASKLDLPNPGLHVEQVVLRRESPNVFELPECAPLWLAVALQGSEQTNRTASFSDATSFIGSFLFDAEEFWAGRIAGLFRSELYSANDAPHNEHFFEVLAAWAGRQPCLIIEHVTSAHEKRNRYIRTARRAALNLDRAARETDSPVSDIDPRSIVLRSLPDIVLRFDADAKLLGVSAGQDFGCSTVPDKALGQFAGGLLPPDAARQLIERSKRVVGGTGADVFEYQTARGAEIRNYEVRIVGGADDAFMAMIRDTSEQGLVESELRNIAFSDPLTGLANRRLLEDRIEGAIHRAQREKHLVGVLLMDLDGFKEINDAYGHLEGDQVLKLAADRIASSIRAVDTAARWGGDEFVVIAEGLKKASDAITVATKLAKQLSAPFSICGRSACVSASIGIAIYPTHAKTSNEVFQVADSAMYRAKRMGNGSLAFAVPGETARNRP